MESDEDLFERIQRGDLPAFDALYARYESRLFGYLVAFLGDRAEAEDVLHDAFLKALKQKGGRFAEGTFRAWLYTVARNMASNRLRSRSRGVRAVTRWEGDARATALPAPNADVAIEEREMLAALDGAVGRLPEALAEVYRLRTSGMSYEEMSTVLDIPLGTVKSQMFRLVSRLREELRPWTVR